MIEFNMPYDFILPHEGISPVQNYKYLNQHVQVHAVDHEDGLQLYKKSRRHKSEIPDF